MQSFEKFRGKYTYYVLDYEQAKRRLDTETAQMNIFDFLGGEND